MNQQNEMKWCRHFSEGRTEVHDEQRTGRPSVIFDALLWRTEDAIRANRRLTLKELHQIIPDVSMTTLYDVVTVKLGYRKLCAHCVPKLLTEEHKKKRMGFALGFLSCYAEAGDEFLDRTVTGDEMWVYHHTPESKQQSMQWRHSNSPKAKKCKTSISAKKIMASGFWDRQGILLLEFMPPGTTINAAAYCQTLKPLQRAIQNKRRGMLTSGVRLLHDNSRPPLALVTKALLKQFKCDVLDLPPYSPDLAPTDFHVFRYLKSHLGEKSFHDDEEIKDEIEMCFQQQAATFYDCGIQKLVHRLNKCLDNGGGYAEK
ncbi:histone-lysine N-methyltransferase SETMAR-like [Schistocerca serialis cubense]|uniref:histone-lysine N-methyltransferase SETMAR-like n=1 Tax=Schistocerca serialis cubense TaxID=2023355 RepID=UPI00214E89FE|nr:histone-lysine N-methyltransferase SETMAR-like [Schistocerca serialis cubense]